ncbi:MAG: histidine phosphatase family protein [Candidatus Pelagibacter sp.]|nr:histidine phosphatase family protein [Candidatus Pelagibacter sp.]
MFKIVKIIIFFLYITSYFSNSYSNEKLIHELKEGEKIVLIRHALAPGSGDPVNFNLNDCSTQRNLNMKGIEQSKKIGSFFTKNNIPIDQVLSSEWCRCKDTAKYAFKKYNTFNALNSFFSQRFQKNRAGQMLDLSNFLKKWDNKKNLILVTHYVVILDITNQPVSSGEIVILDKNLNLIGTMLL